MIGNQNQYYQKNKDKILEQQKLYYQKNKDRRRQKARENYYKDREKSVRASSEYNKTNKEHYNEYHKQYGRKYKEKRKEYNSRPETKAHRREYEKRPEVRAKRREYQKSATWKEYLKQYHKRPEVKHRVNARNDARKRQKGFLPIMLNPFPEDISVDYHHIFRRCPFTIPMPKITHQRKTGLLHVHLIHNKKWIEKLYCLDIDKVFLDSNFENKKDKSNT